MFLIFYCLFCLNFVIFVFTFEIAFVVRFIRSCSVFKDLLTLLESYIIILQLNLFVNIYFYFFLQILLNIFYKLSSLVYSITNNIFCQQQILIFFNFFTNICFFAIFALYTRAHAYTHTHILYIDNRKIIRFFI